MTSPLPFALHSAIVKIASRCNLNCSYCYVYNHEDNGYLRRPVFMSPEVFEQTLRVLARHCDLHEPHRMTLLFHGGEPLLVGRDRFRRMVDLAHDLLGNRLRRLAVQTNATLIDRQWAALLRETAVDVSVSLDGTRAAHDAARIDHLGDGSYDDTVRGLDELHLAGLNPYILCVVNPRHSGLEVYEHFISLGLKRFDFLIPDVSHDNKPFRYGGLTEYPIADYLLPIFDAWLERDDPSIEIRLFENLLGVLMGGRSVSDAFGNIPMRYAIIEADGAIEGLDALRVCGNNLAASGLNVQTHSLDDLPLGNPVVYEAASHGFALPDRCRACPEATVCGGGYPPHRYSRARGFNNPSVWCKDILRVLAHMRDRMVQHGHSPRALLEPPELSDIVAANTATA